LPDRGKINFKSVTQRTDKLAWQSYSDDYSITRCNADRVNRTRQHASVDEFHDPVRIQNDFDVPIP